MKNRTLSELIHLYNRSQAEKESAEAKILYEKIASQIMVICYYMPQNALKLKEELACEFVLYMQGKIRWIVENYRNDCNNFNEYIYPLLRYNLKYFFHSRRRVEKKETTVMYGNSVSEYILNGNETDGDLFVAEETSVQTTALNRLRFVMHNSRVCRKRFFIYLLSLAKQIELCELKMICRELRLDYSETYRIFNTVISQSQESCQREEQLTVRRNYYWRKYLVNEAELSKRMFYDDFSEIEKINESSLAAIYYRDLRNKELSKVKNQVKYEAISKILNVSVGTVSSAIFYSKNLSLWCIDKTHTQSFSSFGVGVRLFERMRDEPEIDFFNGKPDCVFHPYREFSVVSCKAEN